MRILAVDTSGKEIGLGVFDGKKCLYESYMQADRAYNKHIMPMVETALEKSGLTLAAVDVFAAALGPGSFTGIRVGMAVMKSFAHALGRRFAGASTLDIIAQEIPGNGRKWAVLEAGRDEVYAAEYSKSGIRSPESGVKPKYRLLSRDAFIKKLKKGDTIAGIKGENIMIELKEKYSKIHIVELKHIGMAAFAEIVSRTSINSEKGIYETSPVYIRPSEAEARRRLNAKNGGRKK